MDSRILLKQIEQTLTDAGVRVLPDYKSPPPMDTSGNIVLPYVLVYLGRRRPQSENYYGDHEMPGYSVIFMCVGGTRDLALWVSNKVSTLFDNKVYPGTTTWLRVETRPLYPEEGTVPARWSEPISYEFETEN